VDFAYKPGSEADCFQPLCCRAGQPGECWKVEQIIQRIVFFDLAPGHTGAGFW
jgi:hypothetical protein